MHTVNQIETAGYAREHGVIVIESEIVDQVHVDLSIAGIATAGRNAHRSTDISRQSHLVAHEPSGDAVVLVGARAPALNDEVWHDAVEGESSELPRLRELHKRRDRERSLVGQEFKGDDSKPAHTHAHGRAFKCAQERVGGKRFERKITDAWRRHTVARLTQTFSDGDERVAKGRAVGRTQTLRGSAELRKRRCEFGRSLELIRAGEH